MTRPGSGNDAGSDDSPPAAAVLRSARNEVWVRSEERLLWADRCEAQPVAV